MNCDRPLLTKLLLGLVHLADEVDEALAGLRDALLRPVGEVELANRSRLTVSRISHLTIHQLVKFE